MRISDWSSDVCSSDLEGFVEGGFADLEARGGLANCEAGSDMFARLEELVRCDHWPPPTGATSLASGLEACMGALPDQIALKLGKRAEEYGRASCRERVSKYGWSLVAAVSEKKKKKR